MKKSFFAQMLAIILILINSLVYAEYAVWESPRYVPKDEARTPWTEEGNPFVTYYAPWLRNFHIMTAAEAENNKEAGIVGGEACQQIRQLAISPVNPDIMYLCSDTSGVHKTTTGGRHWYSTTNNAAGHDAKGLLCDIFDEKIVFVNMRKTGVHRSRDGGYTWEQIIADTDQSQNLGRRSSTIVQDSSGNTYMAVGSGVYKLERETDKLINLTARQFPELSKLVGNSGAEFLDIDVSSDGKYIYACCPMVISGTNTQMGLYVSKDGGESWKIINQNSDGSIKYTRMMTAAIDPEDVKTIYVGMRMVTKDPQTQNEVTGEYKLYVSHDCGESFTEVFRPQNLSGGNVNFYGLKFGPKNASGIYPMYLHVEKTIYPLRVSFNYKGTKATFAQVYQAKHKMDKDTIREGYTGYLYQAFQPDMRTEGTNDIRVVYAASGVYEYKSKYNPTSNACENVEIKRISSGYSGASIEDIAFDSQGNIFAPVVDVGSFYSDGGKYSANSYPTFKEGSGARYGVRAIFDPSDDSHVVIYCGMSNGYGTYSGIKQSSDGGKTFADFNSDAKLFTVKPPEDESEEGGESDDALDGEISEESIENENEAVNEAEWATYGNAQVLCYDNEDKNIIYSSYHNSYDNGKTWIRNRYFLIDVHSENTKIQVAVRKEDDKVNLYKTFDGGITWEIVMNLSQNSIFSPFRNFKDVDFDLGNPDYIWFIHYNTFGRINLKTKTVENFNSKFDYPAYSSVEINPKDPNHMLITSSPGTHVNRMKNDFKLAESYDGGQSWHVVQGMWGGSFNNIIFSPYTDEAFITGHQGTIIYNYAKFNYYTAVDLCYSGLTKTITLPRINESGENVNGGKYIISPEDVFYPYGRKLAGWELFGKHYKTGAWIKIEE